MDTLRNKICNQRGNPDSKVHIIPIADFLCRPAGDPLSIGRLFFCGFAPDRAQFDSLFIGCTLKDSIHMDSGSVDAVGIDISRCHQLLHLGNDDVATRGDFRVEVARGFSEHKVPVGIPLPCFHKTYVGSDGLFQNVFVTSETSGFFSLGQAGAYGGSCEEGRNACASCPQSFGQSSLGHQLDFDLASKNLPFEFAVLTHIGRNDLADLAIFQKKTHAKIIHPGIVSHNGETLDPAGLEGFDEVFRYSAEPETSGGYRQVVSQKAAQSGLGVVVYFIHGESSWLKSTPSKQPSLHRRLCRWRQPRA